MTLLLKKDDLKRETGLYLGWGPGDVDGGEKWDAEQELLLTGFINSGTSRFYNTPPIPNKVHPGGHDWSFLKPRMTLATPAGATVVNLPEDFGGFISELTIVQENGSSQPVRLGNESLLRMERQKTPGRVGRPLLAVLRPRKSAPTLFELDLFPTTDVDYALEGDYNLVPEALSDTSPVAYGGITHRETLLESCLAVAEERWDRIPEGPHYQAFMRCLAASIRKDRELRPQYYGYDSDNSDRKHHTWRDFPPIRINGSVPV